MRIRENYSSKKELKKRIAQIKKVHGSGSVYIKNEKHIDRFGIKSKSNKYEIDGVVSGQYREYDGDRIDGYIEYLSDQMDPIPPRS